MTDFELRLQKGNELYFLIKNFLDVNKIPYFETGYEHLNQLNNARNSVIKNKDKTSEFIRFYPDLSIIFKNRSFLLEIKNSSGIEKECYMNYIGLVNVFNLDVLICCKNAKICRIQDVVFKPADKFDKISNMEIPVTDSVWREPRMMESNRYFEYLAAYKKAGKYTSGCSFAFIDFDKTDFKELDVLNKYPK